MMLLELAKKGGAGRKTYYHCYHHGRLLSSIRKRKCSVAFTILYLMKAWPLARHIFHLACAFTGNKLHYYK